MKQKNRRITPGKIYMALILAFFYLPIVYTVVFSFNSTKSLTHFKGFSLKWYEKMFASSSMMDSIITTFVIAILATVISTVLGTIAGDDTILIILREGADRDLFLNQLAEIIPAIKSVLVY